MVTRKSAMSAALKYGPALAAAAKRYGPTVMEQLNKQRQPAERFVQERRERGNPRRTAINHASTVLDGTLLRGYHQGQEYWIVFSGDDPVGVYPYTPVPYERLLDHADLTRRMRPDQARRRAQTPRRRATPGTPGDIASRTDDPAPPPTAPGRPGDPGTVEVRALRPRDHEDGSGTYRPTA